MCSDVSVCSAAPQFFPWVHRHRLGVSALLVCRRDNHAADDVAAFHGAGRCQTHGDAAPYDAVGRRRSVVECVAILRKIECGETGMAAAGAWSPGGVGCRPACDGCATAQCIGVWTGAAESPIVIAHRTRCHRGDTLAHWAALTLVPVPGEGAVGAPSADERDRTLAAWADRWLTTARSVSSRVRGLHRRGGRGSCWPVSPHL